MKNTGELLSLAACRFNSCRWRKLYNVGSSITIAGLNMNRGTTNLLIVNAEKHKLSVENYNKNPKRCKKCDTAIPYEKRMNDYCNSSCFASLNNLGVCRNKNYYDGLRGKPKEIPVKKVRPLPEKKLCGLCGKENIVHRNGEGFCNHMHALLYKTKHLIESGSASHRNKRAVRSYLIYINGGKCEKCGHGEWFGFKLSLEMHHKDGNVDNMQLENLELVCPNCHSITNNYKSKNKNSNTNRKLYGKQWWMPERSNGQDPKFCV